MKRVFVLIACLAMLCGCSAHESNGAMTAEMAEPAAYDGVVDEMAEAPGYGFKDDFEFESETATEVVQTSEKLVYTGSINIETLGYEETVSSIRSLVNSFGGMIENEDESDYDTSWYTGSSSKGTRRLNMTVRIPSESFYDFLSGMEGSGKVTSRSTSIQNITKQYADNSMRIESLQIQEENLLKMMEKAETIEDMIAVESRLSDVQYELNRLKNYQGTMDTDVAYSTISVNVREVERYTELPDEPFYKKVADTFLDGWDNFTIFLEDLVLWLVGLWPFVILIIALVFLRRKFFPDLKLFKRKKKEEKVSG